MCSLLCVACNVLFVCVEVIVVNDVVGGVSGCVSLLADDLLLCYVCWCLCVVLLCVV